MTENDRLRLQDYLDNRLDEASRKKVESRLADSPEWADELEYLKVSREVSRSGLDKIRMPEGLKTQIQAAVSEELAKSPRRSRLAGKRIPFRFQILAAAATLILALGLYFSAPAPAAGPAGIVADIFQGYEAGTRSMQFTPTSSKCIEDHLAGMGMTWNQNMIELEGHRFTGGCITQTEDCDYATFAYRNDQNKLVTCQMFPGKLGKLPGHYEHRIQRGKNFMVARTDGLTMTFWQDGDMICVLSAEGDREAAIQLAVSKAAHRDVS